MPFIAYGKNEEQLAQQHVYLIYDFATKITRSKSQKEKEKKKKKILGQLETLASLLHAAGICNAKVVLMGRPSNGSALSFMSKQRHFGLVERTVSASAQHWGDGLCAVPLTYGMHDTICCIWSVQSFSSA